MLWFYLYTIKPTTKFINGLPYLPSPSLLFGNLGQLGNDHPTNLQELSLKYRMPVFQCLFGNQRIIFVNSYSAAMDWFVKNQTCLIDRPLLYTFHKLVSTSQGLTIGTSPWNDTCKKRRLNVQRYMTTPAIQERASLYDVESYSLLRDLYQDTSNGESAYPYIYTQRLALNLTTMLCYATRFDNIRTKLLKEILEIVKTISSFRSTNKNLQDYVPIMRLLPENPRSRLAVECSRIRDEWLRKLTQQALNHRDDRVSIVGDFAKSDGNGRLDLDDIKCICVGLVSGGFETLGSTGALIFAQLATEKGEEWQERVYSDCIKHYGSVEEAWKQVVLEQKSEFAVSFIRELLRMYAVIPLIPARKTAKAFQWNGATIPEGTTVILNAQAANHDREHFGDTVDEFVPERFLYESSVNHSPYHFTFGAGSRACTAVNLSIRILYVILARSCMLFKIKRDASRPPVNDYIGYAADRSAQTYWPKEFGISLTPRDPGTMERCFRISQEACAEQLSYSYENDDVADT
ncbi:uncharacterized protein OGAPODRAFT_50557 [Ogataea polymorpha]|uniref:uncharacterized protein n=1 Tax=Ogataea polymorpha TaxID=460523 RepID=UPI0007F3CA2E|nr:uncharacterized protein OGAPODRAFT_50557 [Ogataea polymorpha]OBA15351.1 hypothetical protein OGAPODRAFT_50557 [Ogataea polymorpha]